MTVTILQGDCLEVMRGMDAESVHMCVTSPPYWGLRNYSIPPSVWGGDENCHHDFSAGMRLHKGGPHGDGVLLGGGRAVVEAQALVKDIDAGSFCSHCNAWRGCHGLEPDYRLFVENEIRIFREVWRVLRSDGVLFLNLGDSYATGAGAVGDHPGGGEQGARWRGGPAPIRAGTSSARPAMGKQAFLGENIGVGPSTQPNRMPQPGLKPKDLCGIPWRVALALQSDGWYLRQDIIWHKPAPMPESINDRCTKAHEYMFLLSKSPHYYFDNEAISEECSGNTHARRSKTTLYGWDTGPGRGHAALHRHGSEKGRKLAEAGRGVKNNSSMDAALAVMPERRNKRSVWTVASEPYPEAHFACFPPALVEPCILAGCPAGGVVLDPFGGAGTTGLVADRLKRNAILIELNPSYVEMARRRITGDAPLFSEVI